MSIIDYLKKREILAEHTKQVRGIDEDLLVELCQNIKEDELEFPEFSEDIFKFSEYLQNHVKHHVEKLLKKKPDKETSPTKVDCALSVYFSENKMVAYICLLPPLGGGKGAVLDQVVEELRFEGLVYGLDEELLKKIVESKRYLHIIPIARGREPADGRDAVIRDLFIKEGASPLETEEGGQINYDEMNFMQTVHKGEVISCLEPASLGVDGMDVTGRVLASRNGRPLRLTGGENTVISQDGQFLLAGIDGVVSARSGEFCVEWYSVILDDVDALYGDVDLPGGVIIKGDVRDGRSVKASGNIFIEGTVQNGVINSSGSIRVQKGIWGSQKSSVRAAGQVQCKTIENATVVAGGSVFAEAIVDSNVTTAGSVYVTGGRGILAGGQVKARFSVEANRIGKRSGCLNIIILNYNPESKKQAWTIQDKLTGVQDILSELRKCITEIRSKGSKLSPEEKSVLKQLAEQRDLYENQQSELISQMKQLEQVNNDTKANHVISDEILPTTVIRLGEKALSIKEAEKNCDVHMKNNGLKVR